MLLAQVSMGFVDPRLVLAWWMGGCAGALAVGAIFCRLVFPGRLALLLGLGVGACLTSAVTGLLLVWLWTDYGPPAVDWPLAIPVLALAVGAWAIMRGARAWRSDPTEQSAAAGPARRFGSGSG